MRLDSNVPLISFVVPVYNGREHLERCVQSLTDQQGTTPYEIILVDDGSSDGSSELIDRFESETQYFIALHQPNAGHTAARLNGFHHSRGKYVFFVDCDDRIPRDTVESLAQIINQEHPDMIVFNHTAIIGEHQKEISAGIKEGIYSGKELEELRDCMVMMDERGNGFPRALWSKLFKRETARIALESVPSEIITGEDMCGSVNAFLHCQSLYAADRALYYYYQYDASVSRKPDTDALSRCLLTIRFLEGCVDTGNKKLSDQLDRLIVQQVYSACLRVSRSGISYSGFCKKINEALKDASVLSAVRSAKFSDRRLKTKRFILRNHLFFLIKLLDR